MKEKQQRWGRCSQFQLSDFQVTLGRCSPISTFRLSTFQISDLMVEGETATLGQMLRSIKRPTPPKPDRADDVQYSVCCMAMVHIYDCCCRCAKINRKTRRSLPVSCRDSAGGPTAVTRVSSLERCMCVKSERGVALRAYTQVWREW